MFSLVNQQGFFFIRVFLKFKRFEIYIYICLAYDGTVFLYFSLELGIKMVPSLISLRQLMVNRSLESLFQGDELPIEVDVPNATHSVFACPILKVLFV